MPSGTLRHFSCIGKPKLGLLGKPAASVTKTLPIKFVTGSLLLLTLSGCAGISPVPAIGALSGNLVPTAAQPTLEPFELRSMQTRTLPIAKDAAFGAVMAVLMDEGFRIQSADLDTGLIIAEASGHDKVRLDFRGMVVARETKRAQVWVEKRLEGASVRANFGTRSSAAGATGNVDVPNLDPVQHGAFFSRLEREAAARQSLALMDVLAPSSDDVRPKPDDESWTAARTADTGLQSFWPEADNLQNDQLK
ncbi:hypothetical protein [Erythrobacter donghaensis]|uniref:hypothetical protein n=1 Tax=Erythrobacter donghaensis TaxID=267135 RepID=UPI001180DF2A|nr:hypothetical protein [Erythrobacter donghaensis]